ncbi:MAG: hypothetical protein ACFNT9_05100 [Rodentibacter sp.]
MANIQNSTALEALSMRCCYACKPAAKGERKAESDFHRIRP